MIVISYEFERNGYKASTLIQKYGKTNDFDTDNQR